MRDVDPSVAHSRRRDQLEVWQFVEQRGGKLGSLSHRTDDRVSGESAYKGVLIVQCLVEDVYNDAVVERGPVCEFERNMLIVVEDSDRDLGLIRHWRCKSNKTIVATSTCEDKQASRRRRNTHVLLLLLPLILPPVVSEDNKKKASKRACTSSRVAEPEFVF